MSAVLVTGGTSGIGLAVVAALVTAGRPVVALGRDPARCASVARELPDALVVPADTTDAHTLTDVVQRAEARWGAVEGLVTAAGRLARGGLGELPPEEFRAALETNVLGTWLAMEAVVPGMVRRGFDRSAPR